MPTKLYRVISASLSTKEPLIEELTEGVTPLEGCDRHGKPNELKVEINRDGKYVYIHRPGMWSFGQSCTVGRDIFFDRGDALHALVVLARKKRDSLAKQLDKVQTTLNRAEKELTDLGRPLPVPPKPKRKR